MAYYLTIFLIVLLEIGNNNANDIESFDLSSNKAPASVLRLPAAISDYQRHKQIDECLQIDETMDPSGNVTFTIPFRAAKFFASLLTSENRDFTLSIYAQPHEKQLFNIFRLHSESAIVDATLLGGTYSIVYEFRKPTIANLCYRFAAVTIPDCPVRETYQADDARVKNVFCKITVDNTDATADRILEIILTEQSQMGNLALKIYSVIDTVTYPTDETADITSTFKQPIFIERGASRTFYVRFDVQNIRQSVLPVNFGYTLMEAATADGDAPPISVNSDTGLEALSYAGCLFTGVSGGPFDMSSYLLAIPGPSHVVIELATQPGCNPGLIVFDKSSAKMEFNEVSYQDITGSSPVRTLDFWYLGGELAVQYFAQAETYSLASLWYSYTPTETVPICQNKKIYRTNNFSSYFMCILPVGMDPVHDRNVTFQVKGASLNIATDRFRTSSDTNDLWSSVVPAGSDALFYVTVMHVGKPAATVRFSYTIDTKSQFQLIEQISGNKHKKLRHYV